MPILTFEETIEAFVPGDYTYTLERKARAALEGLLNSCIPSQTTRLLPGALSVFTYQHDPFVYVARMPYEPAFPADINLHVVAISRSAIPFVASMVTFFSSEARDSHEAFIIDTYHGLRDELSLDVHQGHRNGQLCFVACQGPSLSAALESARRHHGPLPYFIRSIAF